MPALLRKSVALPCMCSPNSLGLLHCVTLTGKVTWYPGSFGNEPIAPAADA